MRHLFLILALCQTAALADDARDNEIFGDSTNAVTTSEVKETTLPPEPKDNTSFGGRLDFTTTVLKPEKTQIKKSSLSKVFTADFYMDANPSPDFRGFARVRFQDRFDGVNAGLGLSIDEAWFRTNTSNTVFYTVGKQHIRWGTGRIWNPTDFLAPEIHDPFASFDMREGSYMAKIHVPIEKYGFNYYAILDFNSATNLNTGRLALRAEHVFGPAESAVSIVAKDGGPLSFGIDLSSAVGPVDLIAEAAWKKRSSETFYRGILDPAKATLPESYSRTNETLFSWVAGVNHSFQYSTDDSLSWGVEYFQNNAGYTDRNLELYAMFNGMSQALYAGKQYVGAYVQAPNPGSWNNTSLSLTGIGNISDKSLRLQLVNDVEIYPRAHLQLSYAHCLGSIGDMCLAVPLEFRSFIDDPRIPRTVRDTLAYVSTERARNTVSLSLSTQY